MDKHEVDQVVSRITVGGLTGGVTAELFGGDFGTGFKSGVTTASIGYVCNETMPHGSGMGPPRQRGVFPINARLDRELVAYKREFEHVKEVTVCTDIVYHGVPLTTNALTIYYTGSVNAGQWAGWGVQATLGLYCGKPIPIPYVGIEAGNPPPAY